MMITMPMKEIAEFYDRHQISEFALFGSVLRDDFRPDSDIDVISDLAPFSINPRRRTSKDNFEAKFRNNIGMKIDLPEQLHYQQPAQQHSKT
jgi:uncharacterized protein